MIAMKKGFLISVEGIDGAGKRTLTSFIKKYIESQKLNAIQFEYPDYSSIWGKIIDNYLHNKIEISINEQFFLYFIDILKDQAKLIQLLNTDTCIILDRYFSSTVAFQCAKNFNYQKALAIIETMDIILPDLTIFIQIPPEIALQRKYNQKGFIDRHEKDIELLTNVDCIYEKMMNEKVLSRNWIKLDGNQEKEILQNITKEIITEFFTRKPPSGAN